MLVAMGVLEMDGVTSGKKGQGRVKHFLYVNRRCIINNIRFKGKERLTFIIKTSLKLRER